MDNLTHSLVGALIGQAGLKRKTGLAMPALVIGANLPDVDAACFFWLEGVEHLAFRRGITHGPIAWVLLPLLLAGALWWSDRWQARRGKRPAARAPVRFGWLYGLAFLACLTHPALDWLNVYGIRLLEPFSSRWFYGDTLFIIDVWLWALLAFATWFSLRREKRGGDSRRPAQIALLFALAYIGGNWGFTRELRQYGSLDVAEAPPIVAPVPLKPWARDLIYPAPGGSYRLVLGYSEPRPKLRQQRLGEVDLRTCGLTEVRARDPQVDAFLFWARAPFAERAPDGSLLLRDARFNDPRARDRFTVALKDVRCEPLKVPSASGEGVGGGVEPRANSEDTTPDRVPEDTTPGPSSKEEGRR